MVIKSSDIFKSHIPYRYVLSHDPKADPVHPYNAYRENVRREGDQWVSDVRYWCSPSKTLEEAEKAYELKLASEGAKKV